MTRLARVAALLLGLSLIAGCGSPTSSSPQPEPVVAARTPQVSGEVVDERDEEGEATAPLAPVSDAELDAMDRSELELRCEQGSTAACDRLGH